MKNCPSLMMRILVVEDHPVVRDLLCKLLIQQTDVATATAAADGQEAIQLLKKGLEINILLTDYEMPVMDGLKLTRRVLALMPEMRIVVLTFCPPALAQPKVLAAGAKVCLSKDGDFEELLTAIRAVHAA